MKVFLDKIARLSSVREIRLQDFDGESLYVYTQNGTNASAHGAWQPIIESLDAPESAHFIFENGRFLLVKLVFGNLIIGLRDDHHLRTIQDGCMSVREKLQDDTIRKNVLLRMFSENRKTLKPQFINTLQSVAGPEVAAVLIPFLDSPAGRSAAGDDRAAAAICWVLGHCRSRDALDALNAYLHKLDDTEPDSEAGKAARIAVAQLELDIPGDGIAGRSVLEEAVSTPAAKQPAPEPEELTPEEIEIRKLVGQGEKDRAISKIMDSIRNYAAQKDFTRAEKFRQLLISTDSMALREIITAAEIIEEEKSASLSDTLLATWDDLIQVLSLEEFSALYHATKPRNTMTEEIIAEQGDFLSRLFFVNSGRVQLYTTRNGRDLPFKTVEEGEVFGADSFFDISVWTVSAKSLGANLSVLKWSRLAALKSDYPALQNNLLEFCMRFRNDHVHFRRPASSRRRYERKKLAGRATMEVLDDRGRDTGQVARGDLLDISQGGLSFVLRFHKKEYATDLLGRDIKVIVRPDNATSPLQKVGQVKAVRCYDFVGNDYSVHVEFDSILGSSEVAQATATKQGG